jgi:uncharacterized protein (TIGR03067 family)
MATICSSRSTRSWVACRTSIVPSSFCAIWKTRKQAAKHFKLPEGTVATRLATARAMLAQRLARLGFVVLSGTLAEMLAKPAAAATLPASVASSTIKAASLFAAGEAATAGISAKAVALAEGVLKTMLLNKLKIVTTVLAVALSLGLGGAGIHWQSYAPVATAQGQEQKEGPKTVADKNADKPRTDQELIQGTWNFVTCTVGGKKAWNDDSPPKSLAFKGDKVRFRAVSGPDRKEVEFESRFKLDSSKSPREMDMTALDGENKGKTTECLYEISGDTLKLCHATQPGTGRPRAFESKEGSTDFLWTLKRAAPEEKKDPADQRARAKEAEPVPGVVSGVVKSVDAQGNAITVASKEGEATYSVARDASIQIDDKPGTLAGIPAGASVHLRQFVDARTTTNVHAEGRWFWGTVKAVDAGSSTITFGDKAQDGAAGRTFNVPRDLWVSIDGKPGSLAAIPSGASVNLQLLADQQTVRCLSAEGAQVHGVVKAVDVSKSTITVNDATYPVAANANIVIDRKPGKLDGVPAGSNVSLSFQVDQKTVLRISATGSSVFGRVELVDTQRSTISVVGNGRGHTYGVSADTVITIDGKPGTLAGIPQGSSLHALNLCVDQQTADSINVVGPGFHHVPVNGIDAEKSTITIGDTAPETVAGRTIAVAADANIEIDGKPGKLAGIPAGAFVNIGLSVDLQTARDLHAEGPNLGDCGGSQISAVDVEKSTITFGDKGAATVIGKTFTLTKDAWITIDGKAAKLADLPTGSYVNITLTVDQQLVRSLGAQGPRVAGVVKVVDAVKNSVIIDDATYIVAKDAIVVVDGKTRSLAELPVGASVSLNLRVDQQTVGMIQTQMKTP